MKENIELKKVREFGDIIGDTFLFIKQNFKPLMKAFFVLCGVFIIAGIVTSIITQLELKDVTRNFYDGNYQSQSSRWTWSFISRYAVIIGFLILNFAAFYCTIFSYITLYNLKGKVAPNVEEVWSYFKFYFFRVMISNIAVILFTFLSFCCCIIPGIYVFPAMTILFPIMVIENGGFNYSFGRAFKLLRNEWWITAATLFVLFVITYICSLIVQVPALILTMIATISHAERAVSAGYVYATSILSYVAQIFYIIPMVASALIYFNLVERKENAGLLQRMENFGNQQTENNFPEEY